MRFDPIEVNSSLVGFHVVWTMSNLDSSYGVTMENVIKQL
jgi:hypothetical protein